MSKAASGDQRVLMGKKEVVSHDGEEEAEKTKNISESCDDESSSSSIGKNSDLSKENSLERSGDGGGEEEVQSSYRGPLDAMETLEQVLPIRRGISRFYNGKSKSFASLADASSSSSTIKDLAKPENAYMMRKRRNLLAWDKTRSSSPLRGSGSGGGGISKRVTNGSGRTTLALAIAMNNSECNSGGSLSVPSSSKKEFSSWRSFSLADLQQCVSVAISNSNELLATK
ncbi:hypothetical protein Salat_2917500 [Sesamum alatum]|uniref:MTD1 n=1 Tax=Sesamum alatum TaxID=300844 RepID=A0AAE1XJ35_9LAMI|nr:hypothetical protein Salat_2917500 [Sesamum alatum]